MQDISTFINSFKNTELARPTNFDVSIRIPTELSLSYVTFGTNLQLRCEAAQFPTRTFAMVEQKTYGPIRFFPIQSSFENLTLTFLCSDNMIEKKFFDNWMNYISPVTKNIANPVNIINNRAYYDFQYKDDYQTEITITQNDLTGKPSYAIQLIEAFPVSVNQLDLNWSYVDTVHKVSVTFSYRTFETILDLTDPKNLTIF